MGGGKVGPGDQLFRISLALPLSKGNLAESLLDAFSIPFETRIESQTRPQAAHRQVRTIVLYPAGNAQKQEWLGHLRRNNLDQYATVEPFSYDPNEWLEKWKDSYEWTRITPRLAVGPDFKPCPFATPHNVSIRPAQAFGTGTHESTILALELLDRNLRPGNTVLDVGCGTGILAIAALELGARLALALDIEQESCVETAANGLANHVSPLVYQGGVEAVNSRFDLVVANMLGHRLVPIANSLINATKPGGTLLLAGLAEDRAEAFVADFFADTTQFKPMATLSRREWWAATWTREGP